MYCYECEKWDSENESCQQQDFLCTGDMQGIFSKINNIFPERDIKLIDYHNLYRIIYTEIVNCHMAELDNFIHEILTAVENKEKKEKFRELYKKIYFDSEFYESKKKLDDVFDQHTGNLQNEDLPIGRYFIYLFYPQFKTDFETLKTTPKQKPFITETENGLRWAYSKKSLSEYFGYMPKPGKKEHKWQIIERLFNETSLKNSFSTNGNGHKKCSKDYELLLEVLKKYPHP